MTLRRLLSAFALLALNLLALRPVAAQTPGEPPSATVAELERRLAAAEEQILRLNEITRLPRVEDDGPGGAESGGEDVGLRGGTPTALDGYALIEQRLDSLEARYGSLAAAPAAQPKFPHTTISGVLQADAVMFSQDPASEATFGQIQNGADFRRVRLGAKSAVTENTNAFIQMDFAAFGHPSFTDVWVETTGVPVFGNIRFGQWKHPFGLEVMTTFRYSTFMERSLLFQPFTPFRHIGVGFYDHSDDLRSTWACSLIRTGQDQFGGSLSTNGGNGVVARWTHLLWYDESTNADYLHTGCGYYLNSPPNNTVRYRSIPEIFVGEFAGGTVGTSGQAVPNQLNGTPFFVDTLSQTNVHLTQTFGLEGLWVPGPLSVQTEAMATIVERTNANTALLHGAYVQVGYFLTGEHRPYDRKAAAIDRVIPHDNYGFWCCEGHHSHGLGAWEIAARYSYVDLNDAGIVGGIEHNTTLGVNWYLNPYTKLVFNYIHVDLDYRDGVPSQTDIFGLRAQVDF